MLNRILQNQHQIFGGFAPTVSQTIKGTIFFPNVKLETARYEGLQSVSESDATKPGKKGKTKQKESESPVSSKVSKEKTRATHSNSPTATAVDAPARPRETGRHETGGGRWRRGETTNRVARARRRRRWVGGFLRRSALAGWGRLVKRVRDWKWTGPYLGPAGTDISSNGPSGLPSSAHRRPTSPSAVRRATAFAPIWLASPPPPSTAPLTVRRRDSGRGCDLGSRRGAGHGHGTARFDPAMARMITLFYFFWSKND